MLMDLNVKGRKALVTGASKGIGRAIALAFAREGVHLMLASRGAAELEALKSEISQFSDVSVTTYAVDLGNSTSIATLARDGSDVDILVNNAGAIPRGRIDEVTEDIWRNAWDLKVFGYINMSRAFYALMKAKQRGVIINILGIGGERLDAGYIAGSTGNAALMAFTRALGGASHADGVRVIGINPGLVATERLADGMRQEAEKRYGNAGEWQRLLEPLPFGRAAMVDEIANITLFLASDLSAYTTGTIVTIDGGIVNSGKLL
jgi:3-oxoacyl-[acyl-carrier protein] reductase